MTDRETGYESLSEKQYYIDKSASLERELEEFPSVYLEGMAASGKTTAVKMLLARRRDVIPVLLWMEKEVKWPEKFVEKLGGLRRREEEKNVWLILENVPGELPEVILSEVKELICVLPDTWRVILISRSEMAESFLELLWNRKMGLISPEALLFTGEEVRRFAEYMGSTLDAEEVYHVSGGWAGCVDMLLRLSVRPKNENLPDETAEQLRQRYEVDQYIRREMWDILSEKEKEILDRAARCPWINEELCQDVWKLETDSESLRVLGRRGFLLYDARRKGWKILPMFGAYAGQGQKIPGGGKTEFTFERLGEWYEKKGYVEEALECLRRSGNEERYRQCMLRNYASVPFLGITFDEVMEWKDTSSSACYLRAVYCYFQQNLSGFRREMRIVAEGKDEKAEEVYLNLLYMEPEESLEGWLEQLESCGKKKGQVRLYHMLGNSCSFLCGIRDLSGLFCSVKKEEKRRKHIWKEYLGAEGWNGYLMAQMEYYFEINRWDDVKDENWRCLFTTWERENWQVSLAKLNLLCIFQGIYPNVKTADAIKNQKKVLQWENKLCCEKNMEAVLSTHSLRSEERENIVKRVLDMRGELAAKVNHDNYIILWCWAKNCVHLGQYVNADIILSRLLPCFQVYRRTRLQAEALFLLALVNRAEGKKNQSLRYSIESFYVTGDFRYVKFYTDYGRAGCEVLEEYAAWMSSNFPEGWHRKKKYNYGNVLRMPVADYVETVMRYARKNQKNYPELAQNQPVEKLTMMEMLVLQDISLGMTNAQICKELNLKLPTVKGHLYSLYKKLGVSSRVQALVKGKELGLLQ